MIKLSLLLLLTQAFHLHGQKMLAQGAIENLQSNIEGGVLTNDRLRVGPCNSLLVDCWLSKVNQKREMENFGLRFVPADDQNIYLLYNYELKKVNARTEIGISVNYFNAFSIKYAQKFAFNGFK